MSWITPSVTDAKRKFMPQVLSVVAAFTAQTGSTSDQLLQEELTAAIREARGYVSGNNNNIIGAAGTIPDELTNAVLVLTRRNIYNNVPGLGELLDENMRKEIESVQKQLNDVAAGRFRIIPPDTAAAVQPSGPGIAVIKPARNDNDVRAQSGLI